MDKDIDFSTFEIVTKPIEKAVSPISECISIERLLTALSYYDKLNIINNENDKILFCNFMDTLYQTIVYDDFNYLIKYYQNDIKEIRNLAISKYKINDYKLSECDYSNRHFRVNELETDQHQTDHNKTSDDQTDDDNNDDLKYFNLYKETMDTLYFYIFHLFQSGLRVQDMDKKADIFDVNNNNHNFLILYYIKYQIL